MRDNAFSATSFLQSRLSFLQRGGGLYSSPWFLRPWPPLAAAVPGPGCRPVAWRPGAVSGHAARPPPAPLAGRPSVGTHMVAVHRVGRQGSARLSVASLFGVVFDV